MKEKELFERWQRAARAAIAYDREIAPNGRYDLCEDWEIKKLESLEREAGQLKMAYIKATA